MLTIFVSSSFLPSADRLTLDGLSVSILEHTLFKGTYFPTWEGESCSFRRRRRKIADFVFLRFRPNRTLLVSPAPSGLSS